MRKTLSLWMILWVLLLGSTPALAQSTPPSAIFGPTTPSPSKSIFFHIFSCYDINTGISLNCRFVDQLVGLVQPLTDETNTGFHVQHTGPAPLTDGNAGTHGFEGLTGPDSNPDLLIVDTFTNSSVAVVAHQVPQFAGRIQVQQFFVPPLGWSCVNTCNFQFVEEIGVDGLSQIELVGPNHEVRRGGRTTHPIGESGTPEALDNARELAWIYKLVTGNGISYNDFSLPFGGKFDLANTYDDQDPHHKGHRRGTQFDINSQDLGGQSIGCLNDVELQFAWPSSGPDEGVYVTLIREPTMFNSNQTACAMRIRSLEWFCALSILVSCTLSDSFARADVGLLPTPIFQTVQTRTTISLDSTTQIYTYGYTVSNPGSNTGKIRLIRVDLSTKFPKSFTPPFDSTDLTIPVGVSTVSFDDLVTILNPSMKLASSSGYLVAYGQQVPNGWSGGLDVQGFALFGARNAGALVAPGSSITGLTLKSRGVPTLVRLDAQPDWKLLLNSESDENDAVIAAAEQVHASLTVPVVAVGPSGVSAGSFGHWDQLSEDLNQARQLGWIPDLTLANALVSQLASARQAVEAQDGTLAKTRLNTLIQTMSSSTPTQRRDEVAALVLLNAQALRDNTTDTMEPFEPRITLTPGTAISPIGAIHTITAKVINVAVSTHPPVPNYTVTFRVTDGPNSGFDFSQRTDASGQAPLSFTSSTLGTDRVAAGRGGEVFEEQAYAMVTWDGGSDLVVPLFVPPVLQSQSGNPVTITEWTQNTGTVAVGPSITRYYLSPTAGVDPQTSLIIGERSVPALAPGEISKSPPINLTIPPGFPLGMYNLAACADAPEQIVELQEENNYSFNKLSISQSVTVPQGFFGTPNDPPICKTAVPSTNPLWPPNHKLATVSVQGVMDPNGDPITITITAITQDEPANGLGDGDTAPDGFGVGTAQAQLRQERSGTGNGRVYAIRFKADDGKGGACNGTITVGVPHDRGQQSTAIDDGQNYDSTTTP